VPEALARSGAGAFGFEMKADHQPQLAGNATVVPLRQAQEFEFSTLAEPASQ
jgi:hypothetical protein